MASAGVATAKAKVTLLNNLIIVSSHLILSPHSPLLTPVEAAPHMAFHLPRRQIVDAWVL